MKPEFAVFYLYWNAKYCVCKKSEKDGVYYIVAECSSRSEAVEICEKMNG